MADYPTPSDYQEAVQFPETAFADPDLQEARPAENALGLPQPITGNFAAIFRMTGPTGCPWAAKCFLTDVPDQQARYRAVAAHLDALDLPYFVDFDYQPEGIRVNGAAYPLLKMAWVDGVPINRFVDEHLDDPDALAALAETWATLMADLEPTDIAHGDLQHGNILVTGAAPDLQIKLVDYDTMYVPALDGRQSAEIGHRNFQHPDRTEDDFGPYLDRFPGLIIYAALQACIHRPELWERFDTGENLLFRAADFYDPSSSVLFDRLADIEPLDSLVEALRSACYVQPEDVPPLAQVRAGETDRIAAMRSRTGRRKGRSADERRTALARWLAPGLGGLVVISGILIGTVGAIVGIGVLVFGGALIGAISWRRYRRLPLVRRHRRLAREIDHFTQVINSLERQIKALRRKREDVLNSVEQRRAEQLDELREEALYDRLKHHFVGEIRSVEGLTHKHVVRLKAGDIRTAYEATPERLQKLHEIGETSQARISMWRSALVAEYEDEIPEALSPAEERRIRRYVEHRIDDLDAEIARAREKIRTQEEERRRVRERKAELSDVSFARYLRYLLRLDTLPDPSTASPPLDASDGASEKQQPPPVPEPIDDGQAWWQQSG